jgi:hypothetical protein
MDVLFLQCFEDPLHLQFHSFFLRNEKKLAWKLFHRPSILFHIYLDQARLIAMSIQQIFGIICNKCSELQLFEHFTYWNLFTLPLTSIVEVKNGSKDKEILRIV